MAQPSNFDIPAGFAFHPFAARWKVCYAETVAWHEEPNFAFGGPAFRSLKKLANVDERKQVTIRVDVPDDPGDSAEIDTRGMLYGFSKSHSVTVSRDDLPNDVLRSHETRKTTPDISGREFTVLVFADPDLSNSLFPSRMKPADIEQDAWAMREEFFGLDESDWTLSVWHFLNSWGLWEYGRGFSSPGSLLGQVPGMVIVFPHLLLKKRNDYRTGLRQPHKWLSEHSLSFSKIDKPPYFLVKHHFCGDAIEATITIDHLEKRRWGFCKRHDCRRYFEHTSKQKRLYCSPECAHLANVRKLREEQRKPKPNWTAAKIAKVLREHKGGKRNAKG